MVIFSPETFDDLFERLETVNGDWTVLAHLFSSLRTTQNANTLHVIIRLFPPISTAHGILYIASPDH